MGGTRETHRHGETERASERLQQRGRRRAGGRQKGRHQPRETGNGQKGRKERRGRSGGRGERKSKDGDSQTGRQTPGDRREAATSRRGEARGAARPRDGAGGRAGPAAELRALPRRPRGPTRPSTRRPASSRPRTASLGRGSPTERWKTQASRGDRLGAAGALRSDPAPRPRPPRPRRLRAARGSGALRRRLRTLPGGARRCARGRSLWKPGARAPARAGLTARGGGEPGAPAGSCGAVCGPRRAGAEPPGGSRRRPAGLAAAPRGSAGLR